MNTTLFRVLLVSIFLLSISNLRAEVPFSINCPADVYVDCTEELWDLTAYGNATYTNYAGTFSAGSPVVEYFLNSCDIGVIKRTWTVEDENWNQYSCTQFIHAEPLSTTIDITWPDTEIVAEGCDPNIDPSITGRPTYIGNPCAMVGVNHEDVIFNFGPQCQKVVRKWTIIDWCTYNGDLGQGYYTYQQVIKIADNSLPTYATLDTVKVTAYNCKDAFVALNPPIVDASACGGEYIITHNSDYADTTGVNASGTYPIGQYQISYVVTYGCSLKKYVYQTLIVENGATPQPYCRAKVTTALCPKDMDGDGIPENGEVSIWAKDFDLGSYYPCNQYEQLQFSFTENVDSMSATFTCADVGINYLEMYVTDESGNKAFCLVELDVQNNSANIPNCQAQNLSEEEDHDYQVSGYVTTAAGRMLEDAQVAFTRLELDTLYQIIQDTTSTSVVMDSTLLDDGTYAYTFEEVYTIENTVETIIVQLEKSIDSDQSGTYAMNNLPLNGDYQIMASHSGFEESSVTAQDAILMMDHILGYKPLQHKLALKAADLNNDGLIDYDDFYALMKVVREGVYPESILEPWYMFDQDKYQESGELYPAMYIEDYSTTMENKNFIAVQKGDLTPYIALTQQDDLALNQSVSYREQHVGESLMTFPNPFVAEVYVQYHAKTAGDIAIQVRTMQGQLAYTNTLSIVEGINLIFIPAEAFAGQGMYLITLENKGNNIQEKVTVIKS